jgi:hypothetical protein
MRQHTSACGSMRQHTSAYVSGNKHHKSAMTTRLHSVPSEAKGASTALMYDALSTALKGGGGVDDGAVYVIKGSTYADVC